MSCGRVYQHNKTNNSRIECTKPAKLLIENSPHFLNRPRIVTAWRRRTKVCFEKYPLSPSLNVYFHHKPFFVFGTLYNDHATGILCKHFQACCTGRVRSLWSGSDRRLWHESRYKLYMACYISNCKQFVWLDDRFTVGRALCLQLSELSSLSWRS